MDYDLILGIEKDAIAAPNRVRKMVGGVSNMAGNLLNPAQNTSKAVFRKMPQSKAPPKFKGISANRPQASTVSSVSTKKMTPDQKQQSLDQFRKGQERVKSISQFQNNPANNLGNLEQTQKKVQRTQEGIKQFQSPANNLGEVTNRANRAQEGIRQFQSPANRLGGNMTSVPPPPPVEVKPSIGTRVKSFLGIGEKQTAGTQGGKLVGKPTSKSPSREDLKLQHNQQKQQKIMDIWEGRPPPGLSEAQLLDQNVAAQFKATGKIPAAPAPAPVAATPLANTAAAPAPAPVAPAPVAPTTTTPLANTATAPAQNLQPSRSYAKPAPVAAAPVQNIPAGSMPSTSYVKRAPAAAPAPVQNLQPSRSYAKPAPTTTTPLANTAVNPGGQPSRSYIKPAPAQSAPAPAQPAPAQPAPTQTAPAPAAAEQPSQLANTATQTPIEIPEGYQKLLLGGGMVGGGFALGNAASDKQPVYITR